MKQECGWFDDKNNSSAALSARLSGDAANLQNVCQSAIKLNSFALIKFTIHLFDRSPIHLVPFFNRFPQSLLEYLWHSTTQSNYRWLALLLFHCHYSQYYWKPGKRIKDWLFDLKF